MQNEKCTLQNAEVDGAGLSRRTFLLKSAAAGIAAGSGIGFVASRVSAADAPDDGSSLVGRIKDPEIRAGVDAAIRKNILPAAVETAYAGHFLITADGSSYGGDAT